MLEGASGATPRLVWSVSGLVQAVTDALASRFAACTVRGELSGFTRATSGHCYFSLRDHDGGSALLRCALFRRTAAQLDFAPRDGQLVELRGRIAIYEPRGELQFVAEAMRPAGLGALYEQFIRLKLRLEAEGLFDASLKRRLPAYPRAVGVITSLGAAALHDVVTALSRRAPHVRVVVYPSAVQGAEAPAALIEALARANARAEVETLILCRGGGSLEDLWSFNDERLVRAIVASALPIVCGVGHETDVTLADLAADVRAPTPTAAAELAAPMRLEALNLLAAMQARMQRRMRHALDTQAQRIDSANLRLMRPRGALTRQTQTLALLSQRLQAAPSHAVHDAARHLSQLAARLMRAGAGRSAAQRVRVASLEARLAALHPRHVLARGYAWISDAEGAPLLSTSEMKKGQAVQAVLADGRFTAKVTRVDPDSDQAG